MVIIFSGNNYTEGLEIEKRDCATLDWICGDFLG